MALTKKNARGAGWNDLRTGKVPAVQPQPGHAKRAAAAVQFELQQELQGGHGGGWAATETGRTAEEGAIPSEDDQAVVPPERRRRDERKVGGDGLDPARYAIDHQLPPENCGEGIGKLGHQC
tara:strand:+ start:237 stop:602 length:366 start_codon:yes stop_codon:yes gene_type:complete